ncbi:GNAT family N-acetyltransferase [Halolamina sp. CBA1230]|uniref:GNAT family N-acetyltransferase n=1 Tax=Halolamina sp. CBA1230 TaxID=1853690 RepID=UPI0009A15FFD|nr:GNAT family N-acetyltransferase [Halolamina sp. CBA1230]QKY20145.1 GNAT family N-acetyltransferase [Halolamina sp. CBA1230]
MTGPDRYPDEPVDGLPSPPQSVEDAEGREISIRAYGGSDEEREALRAMYESFDPADRAQGIPPSRPSKLSGWLDRILSEECFNVFAWDGDDVVGHVTLVPENGTESPYELAIFVLQSHQGAGIGTALIESALGYGAEQGISQVWLTVERWNRAAVGLYEKIGFETTDAESFELEMAIRLDAQTESTG